MKRGTRTRLRLKVPSYAGLLAAGLFLVFVTAQSPHLVHHAFERGHDQTDCSFLSAAEHSPGLSAHTATPIALELVAALGWAPDPPRAPSPALAPSDARAPPLLAS